MGLGIAASVTVALVASRQPPRNIQAAATANAPPPALTVRTAAVRLNPVQRVVVGDGSVVPWQELSVGVEAGGLRVAEVRVEEGDRVRQGDVLAQLADAVPAAQAAQAQASVREAEAAAQIAQSDFRRSVELMRGDNVARQTLEQRQAEAAQSAARLAAAQARRDEAVARLAQTRILAPADGVVLKRGILPGTVVGMGQEAFRILRDGRLELDARVPELELALVRPGQRVRITHGGTQTTGTVRALAPVVAGDTRLGVVHVALPPESTLQPGMFARAEILPDPRPAPIVPASAIVFRDGRAAVFVVPAGSDRVEARLIETGVRDGENVEVRGGLREGERVVATGAGFLTDGDHVRLAEGG